MAMINPYNYKKPIMPAVKSTEMKDKYVSVTPTKSKSDIYLEQKIMSARPEELTYYLYEGLVKFLNQTRIFNDQKLYEKSNNSNLRSQAIIQELRGSLNMQIDLSNQLEALYVFMLDQLVEANISKDNKIIDDVLFLAQELKDTWKEAMKL